MTVFQIIMGIILLVFSIGIILVILLQEGHQANSSVVSGGADSFLGKTKARTIDAVLGRWTKFIAIGFFVLVVLINAIMFFS